MRKLASIKRINDILPILGADRIEVATIDGWQVVVKKGEFKKGDLVCYFEIDSVLPETEWSEFMRERKFRVKTIKLRKQVSQGLILPLSILPEGKYKEEDDVTEILGVTKYDPYIEEEKKQKEKIIQDSKYPKVLMKFKWFRKLILPKKQQKGFPSFISKTDETRVENIPHILKNKKHWVATEKIDGQSGTFFLKKQKGKHFWNKDKYDFGVCSRNLRLWNRDNSSYWSVATKYNIESVLKSRIGDYDFIAIQGECVAPNVQGNKYKVTEPDLYVFNVITPEGRMDSVSAKKWCENSGLQFVPIITDHFILPDTIDELRKFAHGKSQLQDINREGIVFRSLDGRDSFKCVDPEFLLKYNE